MILLYITIIWYMVMDIASTTHLTIKSNKVDVTTWVGVAMRTVLAVATFIYFGQQ